VRPQAPPQTICFSDVQGPAHLVAQDVDTWSLRRAGANPLARLPPGLTPILDHKGLRHEAPREIGRRIPDPQNLSGQTLMVRIRAHSCHAGQKAIP
jgi:hypothetical protein